jgi:hypothetical protein
MPWRRVKTYKSKKAAYNCAKRIVMKQVKKPSGDPAKAVFFGRYRWQAKVEYDKKRKTYKVLRDRLW